MRLTHLTITGADDQTAIPGLIDLSQEAPLIEWGLLLSAEHVGQARFPTPSWRARLIADAPAARRAARLCGQAQMKQMQLAARQPTPLAKAHRGGHGGGLSPLNVIRHVRDIAAQVPDDAMVCIDMESGVRTDNRLDLDKVGAVLSAIGSLAGDASLVPGVHLPGVHFRRGHDPGIPIRIANKDKA